MVGGSSCLLFLGLDKVGGWESLKSKSVEVLFILLPPLLHLSFSSSLSLSLASAECPSLLSLPPDLAPMVRFH